jgi:hypothetical protein
MTRFARPAAALGVLAVTLFSVAAGFPASAVARAPGSVSGGDICVGLLVDASRLGAGVATDCATVPKGSTGADVLDAAGHHLTVCRDGIIGEIDGRPEDGCATKDSTHYWAYWHRSPGSDEWTYSTEGASTYEPPNESTEGWVWQDGGAQNEPPPATSYRRICPRSPSPSPSGSPPPKVGTNGNPQTAPPAPAPPPRQTATASATVTTTATPHRTAKRSHTPSPAVTSASPSAAPTRIVEPTASAEDESSGGTPVGLIAGLVALAAVIGATAWQVRRQRNAP